MPYNLVTIVTYHKKMTYSERKMALFSLPRLKLHQFVNKSLKDLQIGEEFE